MGTNDSSDEREQGHSGSNHATADTSVGRGERQQSFQKQILVLKEGQEVSETIRRNTAARFWTTVQMPDGTKMSVEQWEETHGIFVIPTAEEAASRIVANYMYTIRRELGMRSPRIEFIANGMAHLKHALGMLVQEPVTTGNILEDARHLVGIAEEVLGEMTREARVILDWGDSPTLRVADEATTKLIGKLGKVVWALTELETSLPPEAAKKVNTLKNRVADELGAIIREVRTYVEVKGEPRKEKGGA